MVRVALKAQHFPSRATSTTASVFYRFEHKGSQQTYVGVLAREARIVTPQAVVRGQDGYFEGLIPGAWAAVPDLPGNGSHRAAGYLANKASRRGDDNCPTMAH